VLPKAVGRSPSVPLTCGCTVSPKYTGRAKDASPTQRPATARPPSIIGKFVARPIKKNAEIQIKYSINTYFNQINKAKQLGAS